jgi:hypothetical protein
VDLEERLARAAALARDVPGPPPPRGLVLKLVIAVGGIVYGLLWVLHHTTGLEMLAFLALWFVSMASGAKIAYRAMTGAFTRTAVVVTAKYQHRDATIVMNHLVVEDADGKRTTHLVPTRVYEAASIGDVGVLFSKHGQVWGFHRVE